MAIDTNLLICAPMLQDFLIGKTGIPLTAGVVTLYEDDSRTILKNWYYQAGTSGAYTYLPLPNPLTLSASGTIVDVNGNDTLPFYYPYDENDSSVIQPYYITVYDQFGTLQFTRQNFPFNISQPSTVSVPTFENLITNGQFWRNIGTYDTTINGALPGSITITGINGNSPLSYLTVAPSQHEGYTMPDIKFFKAQNTGDDTITFTKFPQGTTQILTNDITPEYYINHVSNAQPGNTIKYYQFPISLHVQTLDLTPFTVTIQAQNNGTASPANTITLSIFQFAGTGAASPQPVVIETITLNNSWTKYTFPFTFPSTNGLSLSSAQDDAYFLLVGLSPAAALNINFTLPSIYLSETVPTNYFTTYDQVNSITSSPRTGDVRASLNDFMPFGWVAMNNGTIGNSHSKTVPSTGIGTSRQNNDTWPLFNLLWSHFSKYTNGTANLIAQMFDSTGAAVAYGATAIADWTANNQIALTQTMGQVLLGTVPLSTVLAQGLQQSYTTTFTATQLTETMTASSDANGNLLLTVAGTIPFYFGEPIAFSNSGGGLPGGLSPATEYFCIPVSGTTFNVATTLQNSLDYVPIVYASAGTGTNTVLTYGLVLTAANNLSTFTGDTITFSNTGGSLPGGVNATTVYYVISMSNTIISVATTFSNAIQGIPIAYSSAGSPTNTLYLKGSGTYEGEYAHSQTEFELAKHYHGYTTLNTNNTGQNGGSSFPITSANLNTTTKGQGQPSNVTQPGTFYNMFIKL